MRAAFLQSAIALAIAVTPGTAAVICVDAGGGGDFATIQEGLDAASHGDTVLVAPATYIGDGNRDLDFRGRNIVLVSETGPDYTVIDCQATDWDHHRGFLFVSGEDSTAVVDGFTIMNAVADSGGVALCVGGSSPTFKNNAFKFGRGRGGCLFLRGGSSTVENCLFVGREHVPHQIPTMPGGAIFLVDSALTMSESEIRDFAVHFADGGGIYCKRSVLTMAECLIEDCRQVFDGDGGGLYCIDSVVALTSVVLRHNQAGVGASGGSGGGAFCVRCDVRLTGVIFMGNGTAFGSGGGFYGQGCSVDMDHVDFCGNGVSMDGSGGGMWMQGCSGHVTRSVFLCGGAGRRGGNLYCSGDSTLTFERCAFSGGWVWYPDGDGGNVYCYGDVTFRDVVISDGYAETSGGGMYSVGDPTLERVTFRRNSAFCWKAQEPDGESRWWGGGGLNSSGNPLIADCCFEVNEAGTSGGGGAMCTGSPTLLRTLFRANGMLWSGPGGGLYCGHGSPVIEECTFALNYATQGSAIAFGDGCSATVKRCVLSFGTGDRATWCGAAGAALLEDCCVFGNEGGDTFEGVDGGGNFSTDPLFCDLGTNNFHVATNSMCAPENSPCGQLVGAFGAACAEVPSFIWVASGWPSTEGQILVFHASGEYLADFTAGVNIQGMALALTGDMWLSSHDEEEAIRLSPNGAILIAAPVGGPPAGVAVDHHGSVWTANTTKNTITKLSQQGWHLGTYDVAEDPRWLAVDYADNVWVASIGAPVVTKVSTEGVTLAAVPLESAPAGVAVDHGGNVWATLPGADSIAKLGNDGTLLDTYLVGDAPYCLAVDMENRVWVGNRGSHNIVCLAQDGAPVDTITVWPTATPCALAFDHSERLWVLDDTQHLLQWYDRDGQLLGTEFAGFRPTSLAIGKLCPATSVPGSPDGDGEDADTQVSVRPNPAVDAVSFVYVVPRAGSCVSVQVFDVSGRGVRTLEAANLPAGEHVTQWDCADEAGSRVSSGVYFCRIRIGEGEITRKLVVLK